MTVDEAVAKVSAAELAGLAVTLGVAVVLRDEVRRLLDSAADSGVEEVEAETTPARVRGIAGAYGAK